MIDCLYITRFSHVDVPPISLDDKERLRARQSVSADNEDVAASLPPPGPSHGPLLLRHRLPAGFLRVPGRRDGGCAGTSPPQ